MPPKRLVPGFRRASSGLSHGGSSPAGPSMPPRANSTISSSSGPRISAQYSLAATTSLPVMNCPTKPMMPRQHLFQHQKHDGADHRAEQRAHAAEHHHDHQFAGAGPVHHRRADEVGVVGEQRAGEAADGAGDHEADQPVAVGGKADRLHAPLVGARALDHHAEARIDDAPDQIAGRRTGRRSRRNRTASGSTD